MQESTQRLCEPHTRASAACEYGERGLCLPPAVLYFVPNNPSEVPARDRPPWSETQLCLLRSVNDSNDRTVFRYGLNDALAMITFPASATPEIGLQAGSP